jgi:hypothetical protein
MDDSGNNSADVYATALSQLPHRINIFEPYSLFQTKATNLFCNAFLCVLARWTTFAKLVETAQILCFLPTLGPLL